MGLLQNSRLLNAQPIRCFGGAAIGSYTDRFGFNMTDVRFNKNIGLGSFDRKSGYPNGYEPPYAIITPIRGGGLSIYKNLVGSGTVSSTSMLRSIRLCTVNITGSGEISSLTHITYLIRILANLTGSGGVGISSTLGGLVRIGCNLLGSGNITAAESVFANLVSSLTGAGDITSASLLSTTPVSASLTGTGSISDATMTNILSLLATLAGDSLLEGGLVGAIQVAAILAGQGETHAAINLISRIQATLAGGGTLNGSTLKGWASMSADISSAGELVTAQSCAQAVWQALMASYNDPGTMGKAMGDAGAAGNPWSAVPANNNDPNTMGELVQRTEIKVDDAAVLKGIV